jgi:hypothetical protein
VDKLQLLRRNDSIGVADLCANMTSDSTDDIKDEFQERENRCIDSEEMRKAADKEARADPFDHSNRASDKQHAEMDKQDVENDPSKCVSAPAEIQIAQAEIADQVESERKDASSLEFTENVKDDQVLSDESSDKQLSNDARIEEDRSSEDNTSQGISENEKVSKEFEGEEKKNDSNHLGFDDVPIKTLSNEAVSAEVSNEHKPTIAELTVKESSNEALPSEFPNHPIPISTELEIEELTMQKLNAQEQFFAVNQNASTQIDQVPIPKETSLKEFTKDQVEYEQKDDLCIANNDADAAAVFKNDNGACLFQLSDKTCNSDDSPSSPEIPDGRKPTPNPNDELPIQKSNKEAAFPESLDDHKQERTVIDEFPSFKISSNEALPTNELSSKSLNSDREFPGIPNTTKVDEAPIQQQKSSSKAPPEEFADVQNASKFDDQAHIQKKQDSKPTLEISLKHDASTKQSTANGNSNPPFEFPEADDGRSYCEAKQILAEKEKPKYAILLNSEEPLPYENAVKMLPDSTTAKLLSKNFRERMDGFSMMKESVESGEISAWVVFSFLSKSGFKDSNVQVLCKMYATLSSACAWAKTFSLSIAELAFPQCLISLAESKATAFVQGFLLEMAECIGADALQALILKHLESLKNPKAIQLSLSFLAELLKQFGASAFADLVPVIDHMKRYLASSPQAPVRQSAMEFFAQVSSQTGNKYSKRVLDGLSTLLIAALEEKVKQVGTDAEYQPIRKQRIREDLPTTKGHAKGIKNQEAASAHLAKQVSPHLAKMNDSDWKVRKAALEAVDKLFGLSGGDRELNSELQANLFQSIARRLKDSNKNIVGLALRVALTVAQNLGKPDRTIRILLDALCETVGDSKKTIAQGAEDALLEWVKNETCFAAFAQKSFEKFAQVSGAKASLLKILKAGFSVHAGLLRFEFILPSVLLLLNDKAKEVRENADSLMDDFLPELSFAQAMSAMRGFLPEEQKVIGGILEKKGLKPV